MMDRTLYYNAYALVNWFSRKLVKSVPPDLRF